MRKRSAEKVSVTVSMLSVYFPHAIRCFYLQHAVLCCTKVNISAPLTPCFGFFTATVAVKVNSVQRSGTEAITTQSSPQIQKEK